MIKPVLLVITLFLAISHSVFAKPFIFSAIPDQDETALQERFSKVAVYLSEVLEHEVKFVPVKSYAASVTAFRNDDVQLAWFGGLSGVRARLLSEGSQAIAQGVDDPNFKSYFIAHKDVVVDTKDEMLPETIMNKTFTFGSKGSTSGRLMPEYFLRKQFGKAPDKIFEKVGFSGNHSRTIALVQSGAYQVGAVNYKVWEKELAAGKIDTDKVSIIWQTPGYPDYQWTIRGDVDKTYGKGFSAKVSEALLAIKDQSILSAFPRKGFIPASNADFQPVLDMAKEIGLIDQ
ncbi:MAG: phosphonate transport system substrate-binding protein [Cocleimonas sp.]|jgi:phosphonate transport system substrate-binding protein